MVVGANVFRQSNPLNFTMVAGGANPLPQVITMASTGTNFAFFATTANSTGGSWLSITPSSYGCCGINTPEAIKVSVAPAANLAAGTYSSEIIITSADGTQGLTVPVTLTIAAKTTAFFDSLPGQLTYSMLTNGTAPPTQPLEIRNAGAGSLAWTASLSTSDGAAWLAISSKSGTAPSVPMVSVVPANLPGGGLIAGTFTGQVVLNTSGDRVTIPVTFVVGASVFRQVNGLDFNKVFGGASPLPQLINIASTGRPFPSSRPWLHPRVATGFPSPRLLWVLRHQHPGEYGRYGESGCDSRRREIHRRDHPASECWKSINGHSGYAHD